ncbi:DUF4230 domain-containing protein [Anaerolineales bacterium HSG24]|nr:DUF4230 domain-containing protein [Anaerolineales bacterium HSG24]
MTEKPKSRQLLVWGAIALVALCGVGVMAFLAGQIFSGTSAEPVADVPTSTPIPPPVVTISGIKSKAELNTIEYKTITEIYKENVPDGWLDSTLGRKEKLLMLVYGDVRAGFDLEELAEENLWTDGESVRLVLPAPKILNSSIDFDRTRLIYYENSLLLDDSNPNLEGEALQQAKEAIEQAALVEGILPQANRYGKLYFENLLYSLGFTKVEVVIDAQIFKE